MNIPPEPLFLRAPVMWYMMENIQHNYELSDRLIRTIYNWRTFSGPKDDIEALIESGADVNRQHGTLLPLHCACMVSDSYCVRLLLQKGAEVNKVDGYGRTALHYAAERDVFCVEVLLQGGADINAGDGNNDTPLHWAGYKNNSLCVRLLLQHGALVDTLDYNGDTPLSWAARKGHLEVIKILLEYNCCVDVRNLRGETPLMRAATIQTSGLNMAADDACLDLLIRASGQFDLRDPSGQLVRAVAGDNRLSELLLALSENPRRLVDLCRYVVRRTLGAQYLPNRIPKLPVPPRLKAFLLLQR